MSDTEMTDFEYLHGFDNEHETEALPGALPQARFSPQRCPYDLYAEQFNSTAFTAPRAQNRRSWTYRIRPSVTLGDFKPMDKGLLRTAPDNERPCPPNIMRWDPLPIPTTATDFVQGLTSIASNGNARTQTGIAIHVYTANTDMGDTAFYCSDGELLFVPQQGRFLACTEFGILPLKPGEIMVIPRGVRFKITPQDDAIRGYICENYGAPLHLPERGPVGANGYANDRDFQYPVAWFENVNRPWRIINKFGGEFYAATIDHSPFDVVAWTGNSAPYKYDLSRFNVINSVSFDHPDPSIFTVLTSASDTPGTANMDFVIFPPRWMVADNTFRPPWYHRNLMSEFMGLIDGVYDAKETGFEPGGMSLHNCMTPHGPEAAVFEKASTIALSPQRYDNTLAFMFESRYVIEPTAFALDTKLRQHDYIDCYQGLKNNFNPNQP